MKVKMTQTRIQNRSFSLKQIKSKTQVRKGVRKVQIEARLSNEDIEKIVTGVVKAMTDNNFVMSDCRTGVTLLDSREFAEKIKACYPNARKIINKRLIPSPVQIVLNGKDLINEKLFDAWIEDRNNAAKLK